MNDALQWLWRLGQLQPPCLTVPIPPTSCSTAIAMRLAALIENLASLYINGGTHAVVHGFYVLARADCTTAALIVQPGACRMERMLLACGCCPGIVIPWYVKRCRVEVDRAAISTARTISYDHRLGKRVVQRRHAACWLCCRIGERFVGCPGDRARSRRSGGKRGKRSDVYDLPTSAPQ